jgi:hypothetical protein
VVAELSEHRRGGRGMYIVAALASGWGSDERHSGKWVWVELTEAATSPGIPG